MQRLIILAIVCPLVLGCISTKPNHNISALYRIPEISHKLEPLEDKSIEFKANPLPAPARVLFQKLYEIEPVIALETGRIPEFEGVIGEAQIIALQRFVSLIENAKTEEKANINRLLEVGKPQFRRYCTPLQAIFWLLEREEYEYQNVLMRPLESLLSESWDYNETGRWSDYRLVTDRLNAPELITFYSRWNFSYVPQGQRRITAQYIFFSKKGCCQDYTAFDVHCLQNAGYDAKAIMVRSPTGNPKGHVVCEYKGKDGKEYILDNSCEFCAGGGKGIEEKGTYVRKLPQMGDGYTR